MPEKLYAFWEYDNPPYVLGGEVIKIRDDNGGIYVKGYNENMSTYFKKDSIVTIVPYDEGVKLHKQLKKAEKKYNLRIQKAKKALHSMTDSIAKKTANKAVMAACTTNLRKENA